jgi:hypothetical protein
MQFSLLIYVTIDVSVHTDTTMQLNIHLINNKATKSSLAREETTL